MTTRRNKLNTQTSGTTATAANTAASGDAVSAMNLGAGSTATYDNTNPPASGCLWIKLAPATSQIANMDDTSLSGNDRVVEDEFYYPGAPTVANTVIYQMRGSGGRCIDLVSTTAGKLQMVAAANVGSASANAFPAAGIYRIRFKVHTDPTTPANGTAEYAVFDSSGNPVTGMNSGGPITGTINNGPITTLRRGCTSTGFAVAGNWASWRFGLLQNSDVLADIGAYPLNVPPTANAGLDQLNIEPYDTVNLNGTGSTDPDGTIASYAWTQTGGTAVTLTGAATATPSFVAPATLAGDTLTFQLVVTDDLGATSTADTVSVTVLPHTTWRLDAGTPVPVRFIRL